MTDYLIITMIGTMFLFSFLLLYKIWFTTMRVLVEVKICHNTTTFLVKRRAPKFYTLNDGSLNKKFDLDTALKFYFYYFTINCKEKLSNNNDCKLNKFNGIHKSL